MLLGNLGLRAVFDVDGTRHQVLTQRSGESGVKRGDIDAGTQAADGIEPVGIAVLEDGVGSFDGGLVIERDPDGGWIVGDAIAEEAGRSDARHGEWMCLDEYGGTDDGGIGPEIALPGCVADFDSGRCAWLIVIGRQLAAHVRGYTQRRKVVAADVLDAEVLGLGFAAPDVVGILAGLHRRELLELRRCIAQVTIEVVGRRWRNHRPGR